METTEHTIESAAQSLLIMPETKEEEVTQDAAPEALDDLETATDDAAVDETETPEGDADEATEEEAEADAPQVFTVKVDGKDTEVTLDDLKRSFSGQAYIQKGMQDAAAVRKEAESLYQTLQSEQAKFVAIVQDVQARGFKAPPTPPDAAMAKSDPIGYLQADAEYRQAATEYQAQQQQIQYVTQQQAAIEAAAMQEYLEQQKRILAEKLPAYADPEKRKAIEGNIRKIGGEVYGFTDEELSGIRDARHFQVLYDAMMYRQLKAGTVQPKKAEPPKTLKPQAKLSQPPQLARAKAIEAARKSGDRNALALAALMGP